MPSFTHIYHLAEASNWPHIQRNGLHSARVLLDMAGVTGPERERLERTQRMVHTELPNGVQIRDQRPLPLAALKTCLIGMSPADWYAMLNARVFFWLDPQRLNRQRAACGPRPQVVLIIDAMRLVAAYADQIAMTPINTGNARRRPAKRGTATFVPYSQWIASGWASEAAGLGTHPRASGHPPAELTVAGSVPDIMKFVVATQELPPGRLFIPPT
jgi:hypothetical protein